MWYAIDQKGHLEHIKHLHDLLVLSVNGKPALESEDRGIERSTSHMPWSSVLRQDGQPNWLQFSTMHWVFQKSRCPILSHYISTNTTPWKKDILKFWMELRLHASGKDVFKNQSLSNSYVFQSSVFWAAVVLEQINLESRLRRCSSSPQDKCGCNACWQFSHDIIHFLSSAGLSLQRKKGPGNIRFGKNGRSPGSDVGVRRHQGSEIQNTYNIYKIGFGKKRNLQTGTT